MQGIDHAIEEEEQQRENARARARIQRIQERRERTVDEHKLVMSKLDTSGDGNIDAGELKAAIRKVNPKVEDSTVERMLSFADADGNGDVSFAEFKKIIDTAIMEHLAAVVSHLGQAPAARPGKRRPTREELQSPEALKAFLKRGFTDAVSAITNGRGVGEAKEAVKVVTGARTAAGGPSGAASATAGRGGSRRRSARSVIGAG